MSRLARRIARANARSVASGSPVRAVLESTLRSRASRKARILVRGLEPLVVHTPPWSAAGPFLDTLSLELAVGEPGVSCRTVDFAPLRGRSLPEAWQYTLHLFGQMGQRRWGYRLPALVANRRGFRSALRQIFAETHRGATHRVALMGHNAHLLPAEVLEDLTATWDDYCAQQTGDRRCTFLLAGTARAGWLHTLEVPVAELADYDLRESASAIMGQVGPVPMRHVERVAAFTGGIPGLVDEVGRASRRERCLPRQRGELIAALGPLATQVRSQIERVCTVSALSDRFDWLLDGETVPERADVDVPLIRAGLVRRIRAHGPPQVRLRAPAIAALALAS